MPSDTASTSSRVSIPISPAFSTDTVSSAPNSEPTSDEQPDLGAFTTVFWAWNNLQPHPRLPVPQFHPSPSSRASRIEESSISSFTHPGLSEASGTESPPPVDTVWAQRQLHSYFNINSITPNSEQVQELEEEEEEEDEYEVRVDNDNPEAEYRESPPPPSPLSDDPRTVEIYEAASDTDIPDTASFAESLDQSTAGADMALPVTVFSPNQDSAVGLQASEEGDNSSMTSRELPLRNGDEYTPYSFHRSSALQIPSLRGNDAQTTPRRAEFPIHDRSSVYSQSTSRTAGTRVPWSHHPSPHHAPIDDNSSLYSFQTHEDSESAVRSLLNKARATRSLVNDNSTMAHSSVDGSDTRSTMTRDYTPVSDSAHTVQTPDSSSAHSLASHTHSSTSNSHSMSLVSQRPAASSANSPAGSSMTAQRILVDTTAPVAGRHTKGPSFSPQIEPPSPLPTPDDDTSEVIIPYSPAQRALLVDDEDEDDSHTPTRRPVVRVGRGGGPVEQQQQGQGQGQREHDYEQYLQQGAVHPYPHPLLGHHMLPTTYNHPFKGPGFNPEQPSQQLHPPLNLNGAGVAHLDHQEFEGLLPEDHPSLGLLDEALGFIAAERARLEANREAGALHPPPPMDPVTAVPREWQHIIESKRKRRRKKPITTTTATIATATGAAGAVEDHDHHPNGHVVPASPSLTATSTTTVSGLSATRPLLLAATATASSTADKDKKKKDVTFDHDDEDDHHHHQDDGLQPPPPTNTMTMPPTVTIKTKNKKPKSTSTSSSLLSSTKKLAIDGKERQRQHVQQDQDQEEIQNSNLLNRKAMNNNSTTTTTTYGPDVKHITILSRPKKVQQQAGDGDKGVDQGVVLAAGGIGTGAGGGAALGVEDEPQPLVLTGKKGNRVGRKERERAKARRDKERAALLLQQASEPREPARGRHDDWDADDDDLGQDDEDGDHGEDDVKEDDDDGEGEVGFFSSSPAEGTLARSYKGAAATTTVTYKSIPGTPGTATPRTSKFDVNLHLDVGAEDDDERRGRSRRDGMGGTEREAKQHQQQSTAEEALQASPPSKRSRKSRTRRAAKALVHAKSYPNFRSGEMGLEDDDIEIELVSDPTTTVDQSKRTRLIALTHKLQVLFPEQKKDLKKVLQRLEGGGSGRTPAGLTSGSDKGTMSTGKKRKGHVRHGSGKGGSGTHSTPSLSLFRNEDSSVEEQEQDPAELDVTGNPPGEGGALIHIFIDHSNILIGMLNFLKRYPPPQSVIDEYLSSAGSKLNLASRSTTALVDSKDSGSVASNQSLKATTAITIPTSTKRSPVIPIIESPLESRGEEDDEYPITLPSFATARVKASRVKAKAKDRQEDNNLGLELSRSLPTESVLDAQMARRRIAKTSIQGVISDGYEDQDQSQDDGAVQVKVVSAVEKARKVKRFPKHLWHAALVLVLERGRAVSRRVVVTSSPLYQPMEKIQNLGYEVRVYIRVPDLGDGMDRERKDGKHAVGATRPTYGGKAPSAQPSSTGNQKKTHIRHLSGSTSADSGSGSGPVGASGTGTPSKIRYREQGVDELLQLKLHQAIADADTVPKGSTIVLATGDGNVGQFNEDGFLGPVRTALKRGWKVELYAWEDGLSRSWRREFGENSEWGKKGLFSIIPLEQFATSLVEASGW